MPQTFHDAAGDNRVDITLENGPRSSVWWATRNEWLGLIDVARLEIEALYGGFTRELFTEKSREYVFIARHWRERLGRRTL